MMVQRLRLALQRLRLALQRLRQALLKVVDPRAFVPRRLAGDRKLGFDLSLRGLCTPAHRPLLACHRRYDRPAIDDRLGEGAREGKQRGVRPTPREFVSAGALVLTPETLHL